MLAELLSYLSCPVCADRLTADGPTVRCAHGHSFDLARQGYLNLLTGQTPTGGDTAEMVAARADLLNAGHFDFLLDAVATHAAAALAAYPRGLVVEVGAGTGHQLAAVLGRRPDFLGLALDVAKPAVKRAARAHPRLGAVVCDAWRGLPVADHCVELLLDVFAPRNGAEFHRVLRPDGTLLVVTPRPGHLAELVGQLGLVTVDPDKDTRLGRTLDRWFNREDLQVYEHELRLSHLEVTRLVGMGPSARHLPPAELARRIALLAEPVPVTASVQVHTFQPHLAPRP